MSGGVEPFVVAAAIGLLLGFERERHAWVEHEESPAMGTRTFALLGLGGALAGSMSTAVVAVGLVVVGAMVVAGYWRTSSVHRGTTTEIAAVVAYLLGAYCQRDVVVAAGIGVAVALLLEQKGRVHHLLRDVVTDVEVDDALRYFAMALIVLPLLPDRTIDHWGVVNPNELWRLVVILAGLGWVGYVGTRVLGPRRGLVVTGLAGGFVSATATTAVLARAARHAAPAQMRPAVAGALAASISTCVQVVAIVAVVDRRVAVALLPAMGAAALVLGAEVWWFARSTGEASLDEVTVAQRRPLQLTASLVIALVLTATVLASAILQEQFGSAAAVLTAAVAGLADAHGTALAMVSLVPDGNLVRSTAIGAIGAALATNTIVKVVLGFAVGGRRFGRLFGLGLVLPVGLAAVGLLVAVSRV
jgi:uncharacterized membrane protein (DUF4010 family)